MHGQELGAANILQRMWRQRLLPGRNVQRGLVGQLPRVERYCAIRIATDEIGPSPEKQHTWPAMSVHWGGMARRNVSLKHSHMFVFKEKRVLAGSGHKRVQG